MEERVMFWNFLEEVGYKPGFELDTSQVQESDNRNSINLLYLAVTKLVQIKSILRTGYHRSVGK